MLSHNSLIEALKIVPTNKKIPQQNFWYIEINIVSVSKHTIGCLPRLFLSQNESFWPFTSKTPEHSFLDYGHEELEPVRHLPCFDSQNNRRGLISWDVKWLRFFHKCLHLWKKVQFLMDMRNSNRFIMTKTWIQKLTLLPIFLQSQIGREQ